MNNEDFDEVVKQINTELAGKTIKYATHKELGMCFAITLHFTDGTSTEIQPEYDEGFIFTPIQPSI